MLNFDVPQNGKVRVQSGPENYLNAPLTPMPFGVSFAVGPDTQVVDVQNISGDPGNGLLVGKASFPVGSVSTFIIQGPGQFGNITLVCTATITAPLPPPPDPTKIDHFNPVADPPVLQ